MTEESAAKNDARRGSLLFEELWEWMGRGMISSGFSGQIIALSAPPPLCGQIEGQVIALRVPRLLLPLLLFLRLRLACVFKGRFATIQIREKAGDVAGEAAIGRFSLRG
jgi:hypothetical protein